MRQPDTLARLIHLFKRQTAQSKPMPAKVLTIVTPSFEGHAVQFGRFIQSIATHCLDRDLIVVKVIVEQVNVGIFAELFAGLDLTHEILTTETALGAFGVTATPTDFLKRVGKFTFQTLKKLHALDTAQTGWSLVLDSETLFIKPFRVADLVADYAARKYVFFSRVASRGHNWNGSMGQHVTQRCARATGVAGADRWYMEFFHWFYETAKVRAMIAGGLGREFWRDVRDPARGEAHYFEPILYYQYLERHHATEYEFLDIIALFHRYLPAELANRFVMTDLPFSRFGNEYILSVLQPEEVPLLAPLFSAYRLPFLRLEPPIVSPRYIDEAQRLPGLCALVSSQHIAWLRRKVAICVTDGFASDRAALHAQLRELLGFLSGVECDIFVHGRTGLDEAAIRSALRTKATRFEDVPDFDGLLEQVSAPLATDPGRDHEQLWQSYSADRCFDLIHETTDYDYLLKIRPGLVGDLSLKEIMFAISEDADVISNAIYLPRAMHGRGVNIDMALGPIDSMRTYMAAFRYVVAHRGNLVFDGQVTLLEALLAGGCRLVLAEMAYSDMKHEIPRLNSTYERFHHQLAQWWGRNEELPLFKDVTLYFANKLAAAQSQLRGNLPSSFDAYLPDRTGKVHVNLDHDHPAAQVIALDPRAADWLGQANGHIFVAPVDGGVSFSRWNREVVTLAFAS